MRPPLLYWLLALRIAVDLVVAGRTYALTGRVLDATFILPVCLVFYGFLFFGLKNGRFSSRKGDVDVDVEPGGYWTIVAFLVLGHAVVTYLMVLA